MKIPNAWKTGGLALLLALSVAPTGRAAPEMGESSLSVGPRATYIKAKDADEGKWFAGAQLRLHMGEALALEGSIDYYRQEFAQDTMIKVYPVQASLLAYLIPRSPVSPYLLGGAGWYFTRVEGPTVQTDSQNRFGVHAGAGLEAKLNSSLSLDGDWRYLWVEDYTTRDQNALDKDYREKSSMVTIALNLHF